MGVGGDWGEATAAAWAEARGMRVLARNHRCRLGEVDLILEDGRVVAFAEVKARGGGPVGRGLMSVSRHKRRRIALAALDWLRRHPRLLERPLRFDAVEVRPGPRGPEVRWVTAAFDAEGLVD